MTGSSPHEAGNISVTIKGDEPGGKYNDAKVPSTWIVFHGTPARIREQIIEVFDLGDEAKAQPLYSLINEVTKLFKAVNSVGSQLGGTVLSTGPTAPAESAGNGGDVWAQVDAQKADGPPWNEEKKADADPILVALESAKTLDEVKQVWAENQSAFNTTESYMSAYKARGKALSAA